MIEVAGEVEGARMSGESRGEDFVSGCLCDRDRTLAVADGRCYIAVDRRGAHHRANCLDIGAAAIGTIDPRAIREP